MKAAIGLLLLFLGVVPLSGQLPEQLEPATLLKIDGERSWAVGIEGQAVGFTLQKARAAVTIAARLGNGGGRAWADAFLMRSIGPGTTEGDEVARISFELKYPFEGWVDLFTGLDLEAGTYWLVIARPHEATHSSINWFVAQPLGTGGSCLASFLDAQSYTFRSDAAEYIPASKFAQKYQPYGFQFEVWEMRPVGAVIPCS